MNYYKESYEKIDREIRFSEQYGYTAMILPNDFEKVVGGLFLDGDTFIPEHRLKCLNYSLKSFLVDTEYLKERPDLEKYIKPY